MTHDQKNKLLDKLTKYFKLNNEVTLTRPQFEMILAIRGVSKDSYENYRAHGYSYGYGKLIKCK